MVGHAAGVRALVLVPAGEDDGEGAHRLRRLARHRRGHDARVDSPGEEGPERDVAAQPHPRRVEDQLPQPLGGFVGTEGHPRSAPRPPVALDVGVAAARAPAQRGRRRQLAQVGERAPVLGDVLVDEGRVEGERVHVPGELRVLEEGPRLGAEPQRSAAQRPVEGLLADPVASEQELAGPSVPEGEREHATQSLDRPRPELLVEVDDDLRIAAPGEAMPALAEAFAQLHVVVDLAVGDADDLTILAEERLLPADGIDHRQAAHGQPDGTGEVETAAVGPAVGQRVGHPAEQHPVDVLTRGQLSGDAAHQRTAVQRTSWTPRRARHTPRAVATLPRVNAPAARAGARWAGRSPNATPAPHPCRASWSAATTR